MVPSSCTGEERLTFGSSPSSVRFPPFRLLILASQRLLLRSDRRDSAEHSHTGPRPKHQRVRDLLPNLRRRSRLFLPPLRCLLPPLGPRPSSRRSARWIRLLRRRDLHPPPRLRLSLLSRFHHLQQPAARLEPSVPHEVGLRHAGHADRGRRVQGEDEQARRWVLRLVGWRNFRDPWRPTGRGGRRRCWRAVRPLYVCLFTWVPCRGRGADVRCEHL